MKVAAHPMLVAVALGLLGPTALADSGDSTEPGDEDRDAPLRADAEGDAVAASDITDALDDDTAPYWSRLTLVDVEPEADPAATWRSDDPDLSLG